MNDETTTEQITIRPSSEHQAWAQGISDYQEIATSLREAGLRGHELRERAMFFAGRALAKRQVPEELQPHYMVGFQLNLPDADTDVEVPEDVEDAVVIALHAVVLGLNEDDGQELLDRIRRLIDQTGRLPNVTVSRLDAAVKDL